MFAPLRFRDCILRRGRPRLASALAVTIRRRSSGRARELLRQGHCFPRVGVPRGAPALLTRRHVPNDARTAGTPLVSQKRGVTCASACFLGTSHGNTTKSNLKITPDPSEPLENGYRNLSLHLDVFGGTLSRRPMWPPSAQTLPRRLPHPCRCGDRSCASAKYCRGSSSTRPHLSFFYRQKPYATPV